MYQILNVVTFKLIEKSAKIYAQLVPFILNFEF